MSDDAYGIAFWIVVAWPLLLSIPALHTRLPWPRHLAIAPTVVLSVLPGDASLTLPWFLFGTGFAVDAQIRWILVMAAVVWLTAATVAKSPRRYPAYNHGTIFFLLTLAGNLGAILAADLVGFFTFSALMGYGYYGLLIHESDANVRHAGRLYLIFLIVADLALFEALLIAASTTGDLRFESVRQVMAGASPSQLYIWMALAGFALKAGLLPFHLWLLAVFRSAPFSKTLLLGGVPVAMGLLGLVRWLPVGEYAFSVLGMVVQIFGAVAILYTALRLFSHTPVKLLPAWGAVAITGVFSLALGTGLAHPAAWRQYEYLAYPSITTLGIFLAGLTLATSRLRDTRRHPDLAFQRTEDLSLWVGRRIGVLQQWASNRILALQSLWGTLWMKVEAQCRRIWDWEKPVGFLDGWGVRIIMFVLLGLALAWLVK